MNTTQRLRDVYVGRSVVVAAPTSPAPDPQTLVAKGYKNCLRKTYLLRWADPWPEPLAQTDAAAVVEQADWHHGVVRVAADQRIACIQRVLALQDKAKEWGLPFLSLDMGLSYPGLEQLRIHRDLLKVFRRKSQAFQAGAWARAHQHLGDTGASDRRHWANAYHEAGEPGPVHWVLLVHFGFEQTPEDSSIEVNTGVTSAFEAALFQVLNLKPPSTDPQRVDWIEEACPIDRKGTVWFGYKDGITRPQYAAGANGRSYTGVGEHAWGELLLGHARNTADNPYGQLGLPLQASAQNSTALQSLTRNELHRLGFFKNASFGVLRRMQQDVTGFEAWVSQRAADTALPAAWIKAKLMGRVPVPLHHTDNLPSKKGLPSGSRLTPLMQPHHLSDATGLKLVTVGQEGAYREAGPPESTDLEGQGCPYASHIRRMNPRDDPAVPFFSRPLLRRSLPYGQASDEDKGLAGLFFCSDIERQFEHLVGRWANGPVLGLADDSCCKDPIIGNHEHDSGTLVLSDAGGTKTHLKPFEQPFVMTRGCLYAWFPSQSVLKALDQYTEPSKHNTRHDSQARSTD